MRADRDFYAHDSITLAQRLLGARLVRLTESGDRLSGTIVETEAYLGPEDACAHSYKGRRTPRTEPMFAVAGTAYVYFTYGMHHCMNVVAAEEGQPQAVLIRALEPVEGLEHMARRRSSPRRPPEKLRPTDLCSGPGKICQALAIDRSLSGVDLVADERLFIEPAPAGPIAARDLVNDARVGVGEATAWAFRPLRWHIRGNPHVSVVRSPRTQENRSGNTIQSQCRGE
ncbi:MAG: DNA-3-methyladenine glycosylase [Phycisphaerales bacterium JB059]